jgi:hypothetical protein
VKANKKTIKIQTMKKKQLTNEDLQKEFSLTILEASMLQRIVGCYQFRDNICYQYKLTEQQKGIVGSLVKKELIYDSFEGMNDEGYEDANFFPSEDVLDIFGLEHY